MIQDVVHYFDKSYSYIFIKISLLDYLELHLNFLFKKDLYYTKKAIKDDIDILKVRFGHIQPIISLITLFVAFSVVFFYKTSFFLPPPD